MPVRPRIQPLRDQRVDPVRAFLESVGGLGLEGWFDDLPCFASRAQSQAAWPRARRAVWATTVRSRVPDAATEYDGVTIGALQAVLWAWNHITFDLTPILRAIATDHENLLSFERTRGARDIEDYLAIFRADLREIEATARALAADAGPHWQRKYPHHLLHSETYGQAAELQR